ncbi:MAG: ATP-dependent zinc metalloprotease FtsH [Anaerolineales bacterium]|jgi:cell division protease FtsH
MNDDFGERKNEKPEGSSKKRKNRIWDSNWLLWAVLAVLVAALVWSALNNNTRANTQVSYSTFKEQVKAGNIDQVLLTGDKIQGEFVRPVQQQNSGLDPVEVRKFVAYVPAFGDPELLQLLDAHHVNVDTKPQNSVSFGGMLLSYLPLVLLIGLAFMLFRRSTAQGERVMPMTKSTAKVYDETVEKITFKDVAGAVGAKQELAEVVEFLQSPQQFLKLGAKIPKGVLLVGPPGTGKTLLARAVAGEAGVPFYSMSGSDFMEVFVGVGASRVRDLFKQAKENAPGIIFIDELDSIGRKRGAGIGGGHDEREQTLNQLLSEMDGFEPKQNVIVMAATNRPDILDVALQRPGRFDRQVTVDTPTLPDRVEILKIHAHNKPLSEEVDLEKVARGTPGFSGADLANLLNEAALLAARRQKSAIGPEDLSDAQDKVMMGLERNLVLDKEEAELIAFHESGHAIVAAVLPHADPIHKVTIVPRGRAMGVTQQLPEKDRYLYSRDYLLDRMAVMMGGRAAEELALNTMTSGAANDLKQATYLARKMVLDWGMSERLGHVALGGESDQVFLGDEMFQKREFSETTAREIDEEVRLILEEAYQRATQILKDHSAGMQRVVEALIEREQIMGNELIDLLGLEKAAQ